MAIDLKLFLCVTQLMLYCLGVFGRSVPICEGGKVWNVLLRVCECPQWTYWYYPTHGCEPCRERCRGEVTWCEAQPECRGYLQSLASTVKPGSTESPWTVPPAWQISVPDLKSLELAVIVIGAVLFIAVLVIIYIGWTVHKLKMQRPNKDHTVEKMRYEPEGALTDEDRRSTRLQPDTQESEELLSHGAQCAHEGTAPSDDTVRHSPVSDTELHKPAVAEHGEILQQHRDAENIRQ
ncbi:PREDICTED: uncharacterized protein LOC109485543 [Branchiostoma belcheri]|uniref:Uncharacterized protein LOC109485543 n=1 Tax=Branchiostoma belcheri TaxID=7741 RepID=A0A6P5AEP4_BRABE|nr:PREDICTED: uncharacterized protein LOC109485543 [Branchiostoma belcheri]